MYCSVVPSYFVVFFGFHPENLFLCDLFLFLFFFKGGGGGGAHVWTIV